MAAEKLDTAANQEEPTKQGFPYLLTMALAAIVFFGATTLMRGRGGGGQIPLITSPNHYNEVLTEIEAKTAVVLEKSEEELPLTEEEVKILEDAEPKVLGMVNYAPDRFNIYLLAAKIAFGEGKFEAAVDACTRLYERGPTRGGPEVLLVVAEARYVCSRSYFRLRKFAEAVAEAKEAVKLGPTDGRYYWALATTYAEMGENELALNTIDSAVKKGAANTKLIALERFLRGSTKEREDAAAPDPESKTPSKG